MAVSKETVMNAFRVFKDTLDTVNNGTSNATVFTGATGLASGASGLVPAPAAGDNEKFLRGDGQWATVQSGESYTLPTASTSTKGGIKVGTGLSMNGDTLNCTISGSSGGTAITLSNTARTVNGAMWLDSTVASTAGDAITLSTLMPATVVNGSMWLDIS